jgi:hypothetical protein
MCSCHCTYGFQTSSILSWYHPCHVHTRATTQVQADYDGSREDLGSFTVNSYLYLHCWEYQCRSSEQHPSFNGFDSRSLGKLPVQGQQSLRYHLTAEEGVTDELMREIAGARLSGSSLDGLRQRMNTARYDRMYEWQSTYYHACSYHRRHESSGILLFLVVQTTVRSNSD